MATASAGRMTDLACQTAVSKTIGPVRITSHTSAAPRRRLSGLRMPSHGGDSERFRRIGLCPGCSTTGARSSSGRASSHAEWPLRRPNETASGRRPAWPSPPVARSDGGEILDVERATGIEPATSSLGISFPSAHVMSLSIRIHHFRPSVPPWDLTVCRSFSRLLGSILGSRNFTPRHDGSTRTGHA